MKKLSLCCFICFLIIGSTKGQTIGDIIAIKFADRMRDSLHLTVQQRNEILAINLSLNQQKIATRQLYTGTDSLSRMINIIEKKRDSLYSTKLSQSNFVLYLQKKDGIINNN